MNKQEKAMQAIKDLYKKGGFSVDGRKYEFVKMPFKKSRKIYAYLTTIASQIEAGTLAFLDSDKFINEIEPLLYEYVKVDGFLLSTIEDHFDEFTCDYNQFVMLSIQGFSAPFLPEAPTASASTQKESRTTTFKKPM